MEFNTQRPQLWHPRFARVLLRASGFLCIPLAAAVTPIHRENVAVISSNNSLLYLIHTGSQ